MARMREAEVAILLERLRAKYPEEVSRLEDHLEDVGSADAFTQLVREVAETLATTRATMEVQRPILDRGVKALEALAEEEKRRNDLAAKKYELEATREARKHELNLVRWKQILVPFLTGVGGAISGWLAAFLGGGV